MLYAGDAGVVSSLAGGLRKIMAVVVTVFEAAGLTASEIIRRPCCCKRGTRHPGIHHSSSNQQDKDKRTMQFLYLGGILHEDADLTFEVDRRIRPMRACFRRFGPDLSDGTTAPLSLKVCMPKKDEGV